MRDSIKEDVITKELNTLKRIIAKVKRLDNKYGHLLLSKSEFVKSIDYNWSDKHRDFSLKQQELLLFLKEYIAELGKRIDSKRLEMNTTENSSDQINSFIDHCNHYKKLSSMYQEVFRMSISDQLNFISRFH